MRLFRKLLIYGVCVLMIGLAVTIRYYKNQDTKKILTSSALMKVVDIAELSTAKFTYNGIASVYKDEKKQKLKYHVRYNAEVKVGINMKDISFDINDEKKEVIAKLPEISIQVSDVDEQLKFLPEGKNWDIKEAYQACKFDVESEVKASDELFEIAKENSRKIIEELTSPLIEAHDYKLVWNE